MLLQRLALRFLRKRHIDGGGLKARMAEGFLDCFEVGATSNVVGSHSVAKPMDTGTRNPSFGEVFLDAVLNRPRAHRLFELADEESSLSDLRPDGQIRSDGFASFMVEGNILNLAAFASDPHCSHIVRIRRDVLWQFQIVEVQLGKLGEPHAGLEEEFNDGGIPWVVAAATKQSLVLSLR